MADLGPAWIGLTGVAVGAIVTQGADALRWTAERARLKRERRQAALLQLLRHGGDIVVLALDLVRPVGQGHTQAHTTTFDFRPIDQAALHLSQTIDLLRVIGPREVIEDALVFFDRALDVQAGAARIETELELRQRVDELYNAKADLLSKAVSLGLVED